MRKYELVQQRLEVTHVRKGTLASVEGSKKRRGRSKLIWIKIVRKDLEKLGINIRSSLRWECMVNEIDKADLK